MRHLSHRVIYDLSTSHSKKDSFTHHQISLQCSHLQPVFPLLFQHVIAYWLFYLVLLSNSFSKVLLFSFPVFLLFFHCFPRVFVLGEFQFCLKVIITSNTCIMLTVCPVLFQDPVHIYLINSLFDLSSHVSLAFFWFQSSYRS